MSVAFIVLIGVLGLAMLLGSIAAGRIGEDPADVPARPTNRPARLGVRRRPDAS